MPIPEMNYQSFKLKSNKQIFLTKFANGISQEERIWGSNPPPQKKLSYKSVLTTTISDRRRKRRERLRRSNYNFDLSKEEILEILKNRSLNDWKISDLLHALKETFSL
ncbi:hypothetical protein Avbf_03238 [Armadillidium vulgare]|nr:hypothetical protein Avbf_18536 [Armadillidium vulgare]RXG69879.1 hypothetical protein Avbf_03238 [Armadillidium vulgare]